MDSKSWSVVLLVVVKMIVLSSHLHRDYQHKVLLLQYPVVFVQAINSVSLSIKERS
jgi:hypothetical protein